MTKTMDKWRSLGVHNSYTLVTQYAKETGEKGVYLAQTANDGSRMSMGTPTGYIVLRPGFKTDPESTNWLDHGNKVFQTFGYAYDWAKTLEAAVEWTTEKYGFEGEFVGITGFGRDRFPVEIARWAKQKIKEAV